MLRYNEKLNLLMSNVKNSQMTRDEYSYIAEKLNNKNFLVFGTGHDTEFWRYCNSGGLNIFLEHDPKWIFKKYQDTYLIEYTTCIDQYKTLLNEFNNNNYKNLELSVPSFLYNISWDMIFVDGPPGNKKNSIGRMQSIYTAYKLANKNTDIFIHDCDRVVEDTYTKFMFKILKELVKLRHCKK